MDNIKVTLQQFICSDLMTYLSPEQALECNLLEAGLNSIKLMRLIYFIEEQYQVNLANDVIEPASFSTLNAMEKLIQNLKANEPHHAS